MKRFRLLLTAAVLLLGFAACGDALSSDSDGTITLGVQVAASAQGQQVDAARIRIVGPTSRVVNSMPGEEEVIDGLTPGSYVVALEGLLGSEVDLFGETTVNVSADQTTSANITWETFRPTPNNLPPVISEPSFQVTFDDVDGAVGYAVEWDNDLDFGSPTIVPTNTTSATITGALGIISIRVRAINEFGTIGTPSDPLTVEVAPAGSPSASRSTVVPNFTVVVASDGSNVVQLAVTVLDGNDDPVADAVVTLSVSGNGNTVTNPSAPTDAAGQATGSFSSTVAEEKIITATVDGIVVLTHTAVVTVTPGPPADLDYVRGNDQIAPVRGLAPEAPTVRVVDMFGNGVPGFNVAFAQTQGDGAPSEPVVTTDMQGFATTEWIMGLQETQQLTATQEQIGAVIGFGAGAYFTGSGTATIDGTLDASEWADAVCIPFAANVPGGGSAPAELCGMNDEENLYVSMRVVRNPDPRMIMAFFIDKSGDGGFGAGDDYIQMVQPGGGFQDWHFFSNADDPNCPSLCSNGDVARGGTTDGAGIYVHDGTAAVMELSHPLSSGDALDIDFAMGSRARVSVTLRLCDTPDCSDITDTFAPAGGVMMYVQ